MTSEEKARSSSYELSHTWAVRIFALYVLLQVSAIWFHEPWSDELHAWLIARDSGLWELFTVRLRYEVTPGLWHLLLWFLTRVSNEVWLLQALSAAISCLSCWLILFRSGLPGLIRGALPFTYYLGYQHSVVARNYCLTTLGAVMAAVTFERRFERPLPYIFSLLIMAQSSAHGILIAGGLAVCDLFPPRALLKERLPLLKASWIYVLGMVLALAQIVPQPSDYDFAPAHRGGGGLRWMDLNIWSCLNESFTAAPFISLLVGCISIEVFRRSGILQYYLVPMGLLVGLFLMKHWALWHTGLLFLVWLFCLIQSYKIGHEVLQTPWWKLALSLLLVIQISQTVDTVHRDLVYPYFGLRAAARDLQARGVPLKDVRLDGYYESMLAAYYPPEPDKPGYYLWSTGRREPNQEKKPYILASALQEDFDRAIRSRPVKGYKLIKLYSSTRPWKGRYVYLISSFALFEREQGPDDAKKP